MVSVTADAPNQYQQRMLFIVDGVLVSSSTTSDYYTATLATSHYSFVAAVVPANSIYSVQLNNGPPTLIAWSELR